MELFELREKLRAALRANLKVYGGEPVSSKPKVKPKVSLFELREKLRASMFGGELARQDLEHQRQRTLLEGMLLEPESRDDVKDLSNFSHSGARLTRSEANGGGFATKSENTDADGADISRSSKIEVRSGNFGASSGAIEDGLSDLAAIWTGPHDSGVKGVDSGATKADSGGIVVESRNSDSIKADLGKIGVVFENSGQIWRGSHDSDAVEVVSGKVGADSSEGKARSWNSRTIGAIVGDLGVVFPKVWTGSRDSGVSCVDFGMVRVRPRNYNNIRPSSSAMVVGPQNSNTFRTGYSKSMVGHEAIGDREAKRMKTWLAEKETSLLMMDLSKAFMVIDKLNQGAQTELDFVVAF